MPHPHAPRATRSAAPSQAITRSVRSPRFPISPNRRAMVEASYLQAKRESRLGAVTENLRQGPDFSPRDARAHRLQLHPGQRSGAVGGHAGSRQRTLRASLCARGDPVGDGAHQQGREGRRDQRQSPDRKTHRLLLPHFGRDRRVRARLEEPPSPLRRARRSRHQTAARQWTVTAPSGGTTNGTTCSFASNDVR